MEKENRMSNIIEIKDLHFSYEPTSENENPPEVLKGIDLTIKEGEFVAVLGHNGSGKSTLAKHLNAILIPTKGSVVVDGIDTADEDKLFELRNHPAGISDTAGEHRNVCQKENMAGITVF